MNYGSSSYSSGARNTTRRAEYGRTYVIRPKGRHQATIVWLHGLGDNGASWSQLLDSLPLPNIKWICPTASTRPVAAFVKLGIGGFSMGAATALYSAACYTHGKFANGSHYPISLSAVVGLSGWLPCSRSLKSKIENSQGAFRRAATLPLLLSHGRGDEVVRYKNGERSTEILRSSGFSNLTFKTYSGLGHYTVPEEMEDVRKWLTANLGLD
ncbi:Acyl-protein thioesterase 2, partial [Ananas comosus]